MERFAIVVTLGILVSTLGVALQPASAAIDPHALALDVSAFPSGGVVTRNQVDMTAASVNAEGILGGNPDKHGALYQRLHFRGSVSERVLLPRFNGTVRTVWVMATVFPSPAAAAQAYGSDADITTCNASPTVAVSVPLQTCAYGDTHTHESGMYAIGTSGPVEFIVIGFVETGSSAAENRAIRDTSYVVPHMVAQIAGVLSPGSASPAATPQPQSKANPTATPVPAHTHTGPLTTSGKTLVLMMNGDSWRLTLTRVVITQRVHDDYDTYNARGHYVLIFLTVQNVGKHPATLWTDQNFDLLDSQGRTFSVGDGNADTAAERQYGLDDSNTSQQPTFVIHTVILFDVAKDALGLRLQNSDSDGSNTHTLFRLGT